MNLRQIEAFREVMELGTVTRAAEALSISQPAVSKLLAALQDSVGFKLFDRVGGRLRPTAKALILFDTVDQVFSGMDKIRATADEIRADKRGRLTVGAPPAVCHGFAQRAAASVVGPHRDIILSLQPRTSVRVMHAVAARQLDLGITVNLSEYPDVQASFLGRLRAVCVLPPSHPLAAQSVVSASDLHDEPFIYLTQLDESRQRIQHSFDELRVRPKSNIETPLTRSACAFVAEGLGVSVVDPISAASFAPGTLAVRAFEPAVSFDFYVCESAGVPRGELASRFIDALAEGFRELSGDACAQP